MKKGLSMLEILIAVCILVPFFIMAASWYQAFYKNIAVQEDYYVQKDLLITKAELGVGQEQKITDNVYLKTVSQNNLTLEYLIYK